MHSFFLAYPISITQISYFFFPSSICCGVLNVFQYLPALCYITLCAPVLPESFYWIPRFNNGRQFLKFPLNCNLYKSSVGLYLGVTASSFAFVVQLLLMTEPSFYFLSMMMWMQIQQTSSQACQKQSVNWC